MACDPATLLNSSLCGLSCLDRITLDAVELVLLCKIRDGNIMPCDTQTLLNEATCLLNCIPQGAMGAAKLALLCQIMQRGSGTPVSNIVGGKMQLGSGVENGTVPLLLPNVPISVGVIVECPQGGEILVVTIVGDPRIDGFDFQLSGLTDSNQYSLIYQIFLP